MVSVWEALRRALAGMSGYSMFGLCRACWCRQDLHDGIRCLKCGGIVALVRTR